MTAIPDQTVRDQALDISQSYIVQAPAGSGKTSLLTQRYLSLLAIVNNPEEIVAITFTKKAAAEMQERIFEALEMAKSPEPSESYLKKTYQLATKACDQNNKKDWRLFENKHRLRILTIDAFCLFLTSRMPLLSNAVPYTQVTEDADALYLYAAQQCLQSAANHPSYLEALTIIQNHLANDVDKLVNLLVLMLQNREQWLKYILQAQYQTQADFEGALQSLQQHLADGVSNSLTNENQQSLHSILSYKQSFEPSLRDIYLDDIDWQDFSVWKEIAELFLTKKMELRKSFTKKNGFPAASSFKTTDEKNTATAIKQQLKKLIAIFTDNPLQLELLKQIYLLPETAYNDKQWQVLQALVQLLPLLVAELTVAFSDLSQVDFSEISIQALSALGDEQQPTDLALFLDYQISHLLIDEFQDTSKKQYQLLQRLTEGWQIDDGKTLFLVGDPMQSIYRFREAEVGLFLSIQQHGINQIKLQPLQLSCNFRSQAGLIHQVNQLCQSIFPAQSNITEGAISYACSETIDQNHQPAIEGIYCGSKQLEAEFIVDYIRHHPDENIAILIRSRSQLSTIVPYLRQQAIEIEGVDLQSLKQNYLIEVLLALVKLLNQPDDTLSLACLLLSPLCGISYENLEQLFQLVDPNDPYPCQTLLKKISEGSIPEKNRIMKLLQILSQHHQLSYRRNIYRMTLDCWLALDGNYLPSPAQQKDIEQFWSLLENYQQLPFPVDKFETLLAKKYSSLPISKRVKVMTIHKSKGLEFDTVILPSIQYESKNQNNHILSWYEDLQNNIFLLSPIHDAFEEKEPLVNYIRYLDKRKESFERMRLFYVAITRAKSKLLLINAAESEDKIPKGSFLAYVKDKIAFTPYSKTSDNNTAETVEKLFYRLTDTFFPETVPQNVENIYTNLPKILTYEPDRIIGQFIHEQLYFFAEAKLAVSKFKVNPQYSQQRLIEMGLEPAELNDAIKTFEHCITNMQNCETAQWILDPTHTDANNEYSLETPERRYIIDRTFIENNTRWIIDYKISTDMSSNAETYQQQLEQYGQLYQSMYDTPVKLMLYYPLLQQAKTWA